jgi:hypothetical protein
VDFALAITLADNHWDIAPWKALAKAVKATRP